MFLCFYINLPFYIVLLREALGDIPNQEKTWDPPAAPTNEKPRGGKEKQWEITEKGIERREEKKKSS